MRKVGFENPVKPNVQFEAEHVAFIDGEAERLEMGRQGFLRQLLAGLIGYAKDKPRIIDQLIKMAGEPRPITRHAPKVTEAPAPSTKKKAAPPPVKAAAKGKKAAPPPPPAKKATKPPISGKAKPTKAAPAPPAKGKGKPAGKKKGAK